MTFIKTILFLFILLFFASCASNNVYIKNEQNKNSFIEKANNGDLEAMISLNQYYNFPHTKEGLFYYNKWFKNISKKNKENNILKLASIYGKYQDMFPNGEEKVTTLFSYINNKKNYKAKFELIKYYLSKPYSRNKHKINKIHGKIISHLNEEELNDLLSIYFKNRIRKLQKETTVFIMIQRYRISNKNCLAILEANPFSRNNHINEYLKKDILKSKNIDDIMTLAIMDRKAYKIKKAINNFKYILELDKNNGKAQFELGKIYEKGSQRYNIKKDIEKSLKYYELASSNSYIDATTLLFNIYSKKVEDKNKYFRIKKELEKSDQGLLTLASYYQSKYQTEKSIRILEKLANKGNIKALVKLALKKNKSVRYNPEEEYHSKDWLVYIKNSKDSKIINYLYTEMYRYRYKYKFRSELSKYEESRLQSKDILVLRNILEKTKSIKHRIAALNTLVEYKDVKAIKALSKIYKRTNITKGMALINVLVDLGDKKTIYDLAKHLNRSNIQKDKIKSLEYFIRLAKQGHVSSLKYLSNYYTKLKNNSEKDFKQALYWSEILANKNELTYINRMIYLYKKANNNMRNKEKEDYWKKKKKIIINERNI